MFAKRFTRPRKHLKCVNMGGRTFADVIARELRCLYDDKISEKGKSEFRID